MVTDRMKMLRTKIIGHRIIYKKSVAAFFHWQIVILQTSLGWQWEAVRFTENIKVHF